MFEMEKIEDFLHLKHARPNRFYPRPILERSEKEGVSHHKNYKE
jgi:hypothetical protein